MVAAEVVPFLRRLSTAHCLPCRLCNAVADFCVRTVSSVNALWGQALPALSLKLGCTLPGFQLVSVLALGWVPAGLAVASLPAWCCC